MLKHKRISQVNNKIQSGACAFTMDLYFCVTHLLAIIAGKLACLSLCLTVSSAMKWKMYSKQKIGCLAALWNWALVMNYSYPKWFDIFYTSVNFPFLLGVNILCNELQLVTDSSSDEDMFLKRGDRFTLPANDEAQLECVDDVRLMILEFWLQRCLPEGWLTESSDRGRFRELVVNTKLDVNWQNNRVMKLRVVIQLNRFYLTKVNRPEPPGCLILKDL